MTIYELFDCIKERTHLTQKELADYLNIKESEIKKWRKGTAVPSKYQVQNILHFASIMGVDTSSFCWKSYIESVLEITYEDEYRIYGEVDDARFTVHVCRITDGADGTVPIEDITNRRKTLLKLKDL